MVAMLALTGEELGLVRAILRRHVPELDVWAFGSRVAGTHRLHSDLDLAVLTETPLPLDRLFALRDAFTESSLPYRVDILDWASASPSFRQIVERHHTVIRTASGEPAS